MSVFVYQDKGHIITVDLNAGQTRHVKEYLDKCGLIYDVKTTPRKRTLKRKIKKIFKR